MRALGFDVDEGGSKSSLEKKAGHLLSAVKSAVGSAVSSVAHAAVTAIRPRGRSSSHVVGYHKPQSPFLLTKDSQNLFALGFISSRHAGVEPTLWFEYIVTSLLSTQMDADFKLVNPFLTPAQVSVIRDICAAVMLHTNRIGQLNRSLVDAWDLLKLLKTLAKHAAPPMMNAPSQLPVDSTLKQALILKATTLASGLATKRFYLRELRRDAKNIPVFGYDPRFLVFEFSDNIILREAQVLLIEKFMNKINVENKSMCTQMLMGAGK